MPTTVEATPTAPASPESSVGRIVSLSWEDELLAPGVTPAGASYTYAGNWPAYFADQLRDVPSIGIWYEPNIEAVLELDPDIILGLEYLEEGYLAQLREIAPVEIVPFTEKGGAEGARENLMAVAAALGIGTERQELILFQFRLPRIVFALLIGAGLGVSGALLQGVSHNDLADPGLLEINAGAGLGVIVLLQSGVGSQGEGEVNAPAANGSTGPVVWP